MKMSKKAASLRFAAILFAGFALAACATTSGAPDQGDPLEATNRALFDVTMAIDRNVTRPVAIVYRDGLPQGARAGIRNFLDNLSSPGVLANDIFQGEPDRAGTTLARAVVNTTVGVGGIFEVAEDWGLPKHREDFGQTLAVWGVGEGPYLVAPFLGPSTTRDLFGFGVDFLMHPFTHVRWGNKFYVPWTRLGIDLTDRRSRVIDQVDDVESTSADFYAATRSLYRQSRVDAINNGVIAVDELPDF
jgi:phospholipid-binding lipoprotein MlaA